MLRSLLVLLLLVLASLLPAAENDADGDGADLPPPDAAQVIDGTDPETDQVRTTQTPPGGLSVTIGEVEDRRGVSNAVKIIVLLTVLTLAPSFLMMMTCFPRLIIVLGFLRRALGTQTLPPNQVMIGIALFLTFFVMAPTFQEVYDEAYEPYMAEELDEEEALGAAEGVIRDFLARHTRKNDLIAFIQMAGEERPRTIDDVPFTVLVPAFVTSELKTAFQMGFVIFLPFLIIDLVIAAVLMALGMMMLPPVVVSLPFKILLFVLVDGWTLLLQGIVAGYQG